MASAAPEVTVTPGIELDLTRPQRELRAAVRRYVRETVVPARQGVAGRETPRHSWQVTQPSPQAAEFRIVSIPAGRGI